MTPSKGPKVFLSSTFLDLSGIRATVAEWLSGVFGADLIIMETFGSDAAPPDVNSVRRVRDCDLFVGIYAHRYGTIDSVTGKSITELELDEAKRALSSGAIADILLYTIDDSAPWPEDRVDTEPLAISGLKRISQKARQHTCTPFKDEDDLLFLVMRDVYRRLAPLLPQPPSEVRPWRLPRPERIRQPLGMEFLTSRERPYLIGRSREIEEVVSRIAEDRFVLLLGESGVGKTSLIHAGLLPRAKELGWRCIYTRPHGLPCGDIAQQIRSTVFQRYPAYRVSLVSLIAEVVASVAEQRILIVIDQFEDVLVAREQSEVDSLIAGLTSIRHLVDPAPLVLICYRSDLEGRLGEHWQRISGSPAGLPRVYLGGLSEEEAWNGVEEFAKGLSINLQLAHTERARVRRDLVVASQAAGLDNVYPPYVQMLIDHMWSASHDHEGQYELADYQAVGGMDGVIGGYLTRQLEYTQDSSGAVRAVLVSLVRSYGVKAQKSLEEIVADSGFGPTECELSLERLIDLRLVRPVDSTYEVAHDFIARRIASELVDSEEREIKRFRELLTSKAAAHQSTGAILTPEELLILFKHKERIVPSESEMKLLLLSWIEGTGPALYWLLSANLSRVLEWLRAQEARPSLEPEGKVRIVLLRSKLGEAPLVDEDYGAFRSYQLSDETAGLILNNLGSVPRELLLRGLRHRREEVRRACKLAVSARIESGETWWIDRLRNSSSIPYREAYEELILKHDLALVPRDGTKASRAELEYSMLRKIVAARNGREAADVLRAMRDLRMPARSTLFAEGLTLLKEGRLDVLVRRAEQDPLEKGEILLGSVGPGLTASELGVLLAGYERLNARDLGLESTPAIHGKAMATAMACARAASPQTLSQIRQTIGRIQLSPSSRPLVLSLLSEGDLADLRFILERVAAEEIKVDYWNHTGLGHALARRLQTVAAGVPDFLLDLQARNEFWQYVPTDERQPSRRDELLPIRSVENRALYVRLAAYGMIGSATDRDEDLLIRLAGHDYGLIARDAAIRLVRLKGEGAFRLLSERIDEAIGSGASRTLAEALRASEIEHHSLARLW